MASSHHASPLTEPDFSLSVRFAMMMRTAVFLLLILTLSVSTGSRLCAQVGSRPGAADRLFLQDPSTPEDLMRAASAAARLDRTGLARRSLQMLIDQELSDDALRQLRREVGMEVVLRMNSNTDLQPMAGQLVDQLNRASASAMLTADDAEALIGQLGTNPVATRDAAAALLTIGNPAAKALLTADPDTPSGRLAWSLLERHPRTFRYGLLDALSDVDASRVQRGLRLLASSADAELAPLLLEYEFAGESADVRQAAADAVGRLWSGSDRPESADAAVEWLNEHAVDALATAGDRYADDRDIALARAVRFAETADVIDDQDRIATTAVRLACLAAADAADAGQVDADVQQAALDVAIRAGHSHAAEILINTDSDSLLQAMQLPDAGVRVKAAAGLLGLNERVRGIALARQIISDAANGSLQPEAVVIDARLDQATEAVFLLDGRGYKAARCSSGQAGFEQAVRQLSCELILIHANCLRWPLSQTVANLRADSRTAQTPIIVYGPLRAQTSIMQLQDRYAGVYRLMGPLSEINFTDELRRSGAPGPELSEQQRSELVELAAESL